MKKIALINSSTRPGKLSNRVALALMEEFKKQGILEPVMIDSLAIELPQFTERIDKLESPEERLTAIQDELDAADAVIFISPEYNGSYSSGLKTIVDMMPRKVFADKPVGVSSVSNGALKGMRGALQMQLLVLAIQAFPHPKMLLVGNIDKELDEQGKPLNEQMTKQIEGFVKAFTDFAGKF